MRKHESREHWRSVEAAGCEKPNAATANVGRDVERAVAEAERRERERQRLRPDDAGDRGSASFFCVDSFELASVVHESGTRVRVVVVERVREPRELASTSELTRRFALTPREAQVTLALANRHSAAEIAMALGMSVNTARRHTERVLEKLGLRSRREIGDVLRGRHKSV